MYAGEELYSSPFLAGWYSSRRGVGMFAIGYRGTGDETKDSFMAGTLCLYKD